MTFDVEHYLEEVIGQKAEWGHRYISFTNYDLQILDVSILSDNTGQEALFPLFIDEKYYTGALFFLIV